MLPNLMKDWVLFISIIIIILAFIPFLLFPVQTSPDNIINLEKQLEFPHIPSRQKVRILVRLSEFLQDNEPLKAVKYGKEALKILKSENIPSLKIRILLSLTWAQQNIGKYETALDFGFKAKTLAIKNQDEKSAAIADNYIAWIYEQLGFLDRSLNYALQALKLFKKIEDKKNTAEAYKNIGNIFKQLKNNTQAMEHYIKSLQIFEKIEDKKNTARVLNNIGNIYIDSNQEYLALDYYQRCLAIVEKLDWKIGELVARANIASVYSGTGESNRSLKYNLETLEIAEKIGQKRLLAVLLSNIAVDYRILGQYKKALHYIYQALDIAKKIKNKDIIRNFYEELFYIYEAMKNYEKAFFYFKLYKKTNDEIFSEESQKNISQLWLKFKTENKEKEIVQLTQDNRIKQLKLERQKLMRNFLVLVSFLIFVLAVVTFNRYRTKRRAEQQLKKSEKQLRVMNTAKDKLFSIIAHDLESPLSGLILSTGYLEKKYHTLDQIEIKDFHHRIYENASQMAKLLDNLLHWAASQLGNIKVAPEVIDLYDLTNDSLQLMENIARDKKIRLVSHIQKNTLAWGDKQMVEIIMRNLVSNAIKYSNSNNEVQITSTSCRNFLEVTVADNGPGIPEEKQKTLFDPYINNSTAGTAGEKGIGLGLVLCKEFVEKNNGTIRVESNNSCESETGTLMIFTLPVPTDSKQEPQNNQNEK